MKCVQGNSILKQWLQNTETQLPLTNSDESSCQHFRSTHYRTVERYVYEESSVLVTKLLEKNANLN